LSNFVSGIPVVQSPKRLAVIVSHPIQYYAPLYQRLAQRHDLAVKVFFTWHAGDAAVQDIGFKRPIAWDIRLTDGYEFELVPNVSSDPGTHHFFGLRNPSLIERVMAWSPDVTHITGWAWLSHFLALRTLHQRRMRTLFRGDSHLLDHAPNGPRWWIKRAVLQRIFSWPTCFLVTGTANQAYYQTFGVKSERLWSCPHSIDVGRFAEPAISLEREAVEWRKHLAIADDQCALLFAGKLEDKKRPLALMRAVQALPSSRVILVIVGSGEFENEVNALAATDPKRFRVLPFHNQSRMPLVYRLGDLFVLPSAFGETWGLAVNEALACGRPVLVSDRVGCAADVVDPSCGRIFSWTEPSELVRVLDEMTQNRNKLIEMRRAAISRAWLFDVARTEATLVECVLRVCAS
jgi:glycosyltransferase involved in cell wall biosynthesis